MNGEKGETMTHFQHAVFTVITLCCTKAALVAENDVPLSTMYWKTSFATSAAAAIASRRAMSDSITLQCHCGSPTAVMLCTT